MNRKSAELKRYATLARRAGFPAKSSPNAGGWIEVAMACGMPAGSKGAARAFLRAKLGPITAEQLAAPCLAPTVKKPVERPRLEVVRPAPQAQPFEVTDAFLQSYQWRKARMQALIEHGARCQCCGASPATGAVMNVDHIKPRKTHPELALDQSNLQVLCAECNHGKGNWSVKDWRRA